MQACSHKQRMPGMITKVSLSATVGVKYSSVFHGMGTVGRMTKTESPRLLKTHAPSECRQNTSNRDASGPNCEVARSSEMAGGDS